MESSEATTATTRVDPQQAKKMLGVDILWAIDLANIVRAIDGFNSVHDLLEGYPGDAQNCVLAKTFNCEATVEGHPARITDPETGFNTSWENWLSQNPSYKTIVEKNSVVSKQSDNRKFSWFVHFKEEKYAEALAKELGTQVLFSLEISNFSFDAGTYEERYAVLLPKDVAKIAAEFDRGNLPEYIEDYP